MEKNLIGILKEWLKNYVMVPLKDIEYIEIRLKSYLLYVLILLVLKGLITQELKTFSIEKLDIYVL